MSERDDGIGRVAEGGCRCGAVGVRAVGEPSIVVYCYCADCRRSSGAPASLFAGYRADGVEMDRGAVEVYASSPGVVRSFCPTCGTPLSYEDARLEGEVYVHVGVFDDLELFEPEAHSWVSQKPGWIVIRDDLPRYEESSVPR